LTLKRAQFGRTDLQVSELGLGCARIGGIFKNDPAQFVELLSAARDRGINFFDTADMYSQGESEMLIGRAFKRRRDQVIIASKVGYSLPSRRRWIARIKPLVRPLIRVLRIKRERLSLGVKGEITQNFAPEYLRAAVEASLRRLKTDYLDLLQLHSPPSDVIARGDWLNALETLKSAGKVRYYGISCDTPAAADAALSFGSISALQVPVSLLHPVFTDAVLPAAHARGVAVIARECLANGLLVKAQADLDLSFKDLSEDEAARRRAQLTSLRHNAKERGVPLSRLALDYVTGLAGVSVALVGASRVDQLHGTLREFGR
jgi:aryl-alcohol dehydrogenase-like predicted oxidoreductase